MDARILAQQLELRHGVELEGMVENVKGEDFAAIRPRGTDRPHGFSVLVARSPKFILASFGIEEYAGRLMRQLAEADEETRAVFAALIDAASETGLRITIEVNGDPLVAPEILPYGSWDQLEIECQKRLPFHMINEKGLYDLAVDVASMCLSLVLCLLPVDADQEDENNAAAWYSEGAVAKIGANRYERDRRLRAICIAYFGPICGVCGLDFSKMYGRIGVGFIEVHHKVPLSQFGGERLVNPIEDLIPVCANCHAMLHRQNPPLDIEALQKLVAKERESLSIPEYLHLGVKC